MVWGDIVFRFKKMGGDDMGVNIVIFNLDHTSMLTPRYFYLNIVVLKFGRNMSFSNLFK